MFINFWYAAARSAALSAKPLGVRMLGQDFALFRDRDGRAHCVANRCTHRGAALADGRVADGLLQCPYHGWSFDGDGHCRWIPSLGRAAQPPQRARIDAYPTVEKYGIVFAFLGDLPEPERPGILEIPEWQQPGWTFDHYDFTLKTNYERAIENALDPAHTEFVHPAMGYQGAEEGYRVPDFTIERKSWGAGAMIEFEPPPPRGVWRILRKPGTKVISGSGFHGPSHVWTYVHITARAWSHQYIYHTPIDEYADRVFFINARNFLTSRLFKKGADRRALAIIEQDRRIIENLEPLFTPQSAHEQLSVRADALSMHYRERLREWTERGWRIDTARLAAERPRSRVLTIPSPARREHTSWVYDTVPLVPARAAAAVSA
ncbi:MAG: aromatic ring-hydroxylating dioxygenase subunit alpha [Steroidobacteraceae bacterium]|nr:aromatic ring-hydroxylating dioxygenase subunit alpha [Steroidobacteraceae bacterium]MDW8259075.1 aromatic ring-hydroxylating dioxygenase subunit alpha [Gammaproteobacteria bacterium]